MRTARLFRAGLPWSAQQMSISSRARVKGMRVAPSVYCLKSRKKWVVIEGPTHHGSVMFRREAYLKAGGYRAAFYHAQDWDLWFRLATSGTFAMVGQCLYRARITPGSISSSNRCRQAAYARLSHKAITLRLSGHSDATAVQEAERLFPRKSGAIRKIRSKPDDVFHRQVSDEQQRFSRHALIF